MAIIEIENLFKKFLIYHKRQPASESLKEILTQKIKNSLRNLLRRPREEDAFCPSEEFLALNNVSLSIQEGDRVALLGRNGAGKSTLFKILSRITEPTSGRISIHGRVASLLEVGTGFHPDLTGRENILLNGVVMGMSYREIKAKFDEIVAFAEVEKFLDTPIKRYSSGMFMRLGFAIAAHLESEIMIVDEVLAVGDVQFQEKCLNKMNEIGKQNRTILFVSHSVNSVLSLCNKGIFLEKGRLQAFEPIEQCVSRYMRSCPLAGLQWEGNVGDDSIRFIQANLRTLHKEVDFFYQGEKTFLDISLEMMTPQPNLILGFTILNARYQPIARSHINCQKNFCSIFKTCGKHKISFELDLDLFHPGEYHVRLECSIQNKKRILQEEIMLKFAVCSQNNNLLQHDMSVDKDGMSLGNRWQLL